MHEGLAKASLLNILWAGAAAVRTTSEAEPLRGGAETCRLNFCKENVGSLDDSSIHILAHFPSGQANLFLLLYTCAQSEQDGAGTKLNCAQQKSSRVLNPAFTL